MEEKNIFCVVALDGISSNHVMNYNILKGFLNCGYNLFGVVINGYSNDNDCQSECKSLFERFVIIDGHSLEYGYKFFLRSFLHCDKSICAIMDRINDDVKDVFHNIDFSYFVSFASPIHAHILSMNIIKEHCPNLKRYIQFWSDPICGSMMNYKGHIPLKRKPIAYLEKKCISQCENNVFGTKPLALFQRKLYSKYAEKIKYSDIACCPSDNTTALTNRDRIKVGFFGAYASNQRNLIPLIKAVMELTEKVDLVICGDGDIPFDLAECSDNVTIISKRIPYIEANKMEATCDVLVSVGNLSGCQIPGKTLYYAGTNKPIIFVCDGEYSLIHYDYLSQFNRYIICRKNDQFEIKKAIFEAIELIGHEEHLEIPNRMLPENVAHQILGQDG